MYFRSLVGAIFCLCVFSSNANLQEEKFPRFGITCSAVVPVVFDRTNVSTQKISTCVSGLTDDMTLEDLVRVQSEISGEMACVPTENKRAVNRLFVNLQFRAALAGDWYALEKLAEPPVTLTDEVLANNVKLDGESLTSQEMLFISGKLSRAIEDGEENLSQVLEDTLRKIKSAPASRRGSFASDIDDLSGHADSE